MPKTNRKNGRPKAERHISVRSVRREEPDLRKLARALIGLAMAQAEADAQRESEPGESAAPTSPVVDPDGEGMHGDR
jgi:hypothetical protein